MAEELLNTATQAAAVVAARSSSVDRENGAATSSSEDPSVSPDQATSPSHQRLRTASFLARSSLSPGTAPRSPPLGSTSHDKNDAKDMTERKEAGIAAENREFLLKLERELIATGTNLERDGSIKASSSGADPLQAFDLAARDKSVDREKDNAELMKFLDIGENDLASSSNGQDFCALPFISTRNSLEVNTLTWMNGFSYYSQMRMHKSMSKRCTLRMCVGSCTFWTRSNKPDCAWKTSWTI